MSIDDLTMQRKERKRVLLIGTYCSKNKGDAAMQQVFVAELQRCLPNTEVAIASPFPELDVPHYAPVTVIRSRRRNLPLATLHWLLLEILHMIGHTPRHYPLSEEVDAMIQADAIVDLSGDMLTEDYGPLVGYSHFLPLLQAQALGRPVIICAQSVGPFRKLASLAKRIFSRAKLVTVRETFSPKLLDKLNEPAITPLHTADLAFMLQPAPASRVNAILATEAIPPHTQPRLGISVSALLANKTNRHLGTNDKDKLAIFAQALDHVVDKLGVEVLLVPHVCGPRPSADDRQVGQRMAEQMRHPPLSLNGEYRPEEIKGIIATCDAFVGCRMHANIAALDNGIPVLAIGYSHKTLGILNDLGLSEWVIPVNDLDPQQLSSTIMKLFAQTSTYRQQLKATLPEMKKRSRQNIDAVVQLLSKQTGLAKSEPICRTH